MPETPRGLEFPDSTGSTELWVHLQNLAESADTAIGAAQADAVTEAADDAAALYGLTAHADHYRPANVAIGNNVEANLDVDSAAIADENITYQPLIDNFHIDVAGLYQINVVATFENNGNGARILRLYVNGAVRQTVTTRPQAGSQQSTTLSKSVRLAAGDSVKATVQQSSGVGLDLLGGATRPTTFDITRIGN